MSASEEAITVVLIQHDDDRCEWTMYYNNHAIVDYYIYYFPLEKLSFTVIFLHGFDLDQKHPRIPSSSAFQIPVQAGRVLIHHTILDKGAAASVISQKAWEEMGSPTLTPSQTMLKAFYGYDFTS